MTQHQQVVKRELQLFIDQYEGRLEAARALGLSRQMIDAMLAGKRRVAPETALACEQLTKGLVCKSRLVWGQG